MNTSKVIDIDSYIEKFSPKEKQLMADLRRIIHSTIKCNETIAYSMPAMRYGGKIICCFAMHKNHLGFYPYSGKVISKIKNDLKNYTTTKGAVHFPKDKKLPIGIIKKLLQTRKQEI